MQFKNLREAINNRSETAPTLYSAACLVEEVFKEYIAEANCTSIGEVPVGDDKLPNMLIRLSSIIAEIYNTNVASMTKNKERLDKAMEELAKITEELKQYSDVEENKAKEARRLKDLEKQLEEKQAAQKEYDELVAKCIEIQNELNKRKKELPLDAKRDEKDALEKEEKDLLDEAKSLDNDLKKIEREVGRLEDDNTSVKDSIKLLTAEKEAKEKKKEELDKQCTELKQDNNNLAADIARITLTRKDLETVFNLIELDWDKENNSLIGSVDAVTEKLNGVFSDMEGSKAMLNKANVDMLLKITKAAGEIETIKDNIKKREKELTNLNEKITSGNRKLGELLDQYNKRDEQLSSLLDSDQKCKELEKMIADAQQRIDELSKAEQNVVSLEKENEERQKKISEYEARSEKANEDKRRLDRILTADFMASIESLNGKMEMLERISKELVNDSRIMYDKPFVFEEDNVYNRLAECQNTVEQMRQAIKDYNALHNQ